jgi:hypothetical protein
LPYIHDTLAKPQSGKDPRLSAWTETAIAIELAVLCRITINTLSGVLQWGFNPPKYVTKSKGGYALSLPQQEFNTSPAAPSWCRSWPRTPQAREKGPNIEAHCQADVALNRYCCTAAA